VTWAALLAAALGGGVLALLLDAWYTNLRGYETARLQVLDDLDSIWAMSKALAEHRDSFAPAALDEMRYPTGAWREYRAVMAIRLERTDPQLLVRLSKLFSALDLSVVRAPLDDSLLTMTVDLLRDIRTATVGDVGLLVVYGPRYLARNRRERRQAAG